MFFLHDRIVIDGAIRMIKVKNYRGVKPIDNPEWDLTKAYPTLKDDDYWGSYWEGEYYSEPFNVAHYDEVYFRLANGQLTIEPFDIICNYRGDAEAIGNALLMGEAYGRYLSDFYEIFHNFHLSDLIEDSEVRRLKKEELVLALHNHLDDLLSISRNEPDTEYRNEADNPAYQYQVGSRLSVKFMLNFFCRRNGFTLRKPGYVYFIHSDNGVFKIGRSVDVPNRMKDMFPIIMPFTPKLVLSIPSSCPEKLEYAFHKAFAPYKVQGEWFKLTQQHLLTIGELANEKFFDELNKKITG